MEKIIFKNFPYKTTPLNDTNLNQLQTNVENAIDEKVGKVEGKGLSTNDYTTTEKNKLAGIEPGANNYSHPASHPASMITQDSNNRFVSDTEKSNWNNKSDFSGSYNDLSSKPDLSNLHSHSNKTVIDKFTEVSGELKYDGNAIGGEVENLTSTKLTLGNWEIEEDSTTGNLKFSVVSE